MIDRLLMRYLRWRGWVVFWLDEDARICSDLSCCWMRIYEEHRKKL